MTGFQTSVMVTLEIHLINERSYRLYPTAMALGFESLAYVNRTTGQPGQRSSQGSGGEGWVVNELP